MPEKPKPVDLAKIKTLPAAEMSTRVDFSQLAGVPDVEAPLADFFAALPTINKAHDLLTAAHRIAECHVHDRSCVVVVDSQSIASGLGPLIVRMMEERLVHFVAFSGEGALFDFELATTGRTCEDVAAGLAVGAAGMGKETADQFNRIVNDGVRFSSGLGEAVARGLRHQLPKHERLSVLANAHRLGVSVSVHVGIGTDTIHQHPSFNAEAYAKGSFRDFRLLSGALGSVDHGGVILNLARESMMVDVLIRTLTVARNLGTELRDFTYVSLGREALAGTCPLASRENIAIPGPAELLVPLLYAATRTFLRQPA